MTRTSAFLFCPTHPSALNGVATSISTDISYLLSYYDSIYVYYSGPKYANNSSSSNINIVHVDVAGSYRFPSFYSKRFWTLKNLFNSCTGDLFFYCWHTPFTDALLFYNPIPCQKISVISHGTFCSLKLLPKNPSLMRSIILDLLYRYVAIPKIIRKLSSLSVLSISLIQDDRFSDLKVCLKQKPSILRINPNIPYTAPDIMPPETLNSFFPPNQNNSLDFILITRLTKQKGMNKLFKFAVDLKSLLESYSLRDRISIRFSIFTSGLPTSRLPFKIDNIRDLSSNSVNLNYSVDWNISHSEIIDRISLLDNPVGLSLSETECEPYSITELLALGLPCFSLSAGNLSSLDGVHVGKSIQQLSALAFLYFISKSFRYYSANLCQSYIHRSVGQKLSKSYYFAQVN